MTYKVIFNSHGYYEEKIRTNSWIEFSRELLKLVEHYGEPPDFIYLISMRD